MKFDSVTQFENHLRKAAPDHLSRGYLFLIPCEVERRFYAKKVYSFLRHYKPSLEWQGDKKESTPISELLEEELFGSDRYIFLDRFKEMPKKGLLEAVRQIPRSRVIALGDEDCSKDWMKGLEQEVVILDLTKEKPWDKKKRYFEEVQKKARNAKANLSQDAWELLYDNVGPNFSLLLQEIDKILCYVGDKKQIDKKDVEAISCKQKEVNLWHLAEALVFGEEIDPEFSLKDFSDFLLLLHAIRQNLYLGIRILESEKRGEPLDTKYLKFRKNKEEGYRRFCRQKGLSYFTKGLVQAFYFELKGKTTSVTPSMLFDLLRIALYTEKSVQ